jgi:hypothetical protein
MHSMTVFTTILALECILGIVALLSIAILPGTDGDQKGFDPP